MLKPYWTHGIAAIIFVLLARLGSSSLSYVLKLLVDAITTFDVGAQNFVPLQSNPWFLAGIYAVIVVISELIWRCSGFCGMRWTMHTRAHTYQSLFSYLSGHGSKYFSDRFAGSLTNKISNIVSALDRFITGSLWHYWPLFIQICFSTTLIYFASPLLALIFGGWIILFFTINYVFVQKVSKLSEASSKAASNLTGQMVDIASNIALVHFHSKREQELSYLNKYIEKDRVVGLRAWQYSEWVLLLNGLLQGILIAAILYGILHFWQAGTITLGEVVMIIQLLIVMMGDLLFIGMSMKDFMENYGKMKEGLDEIIVDYDIQDVQNAKNLKASSGNIGFENIYFHYKKGKSVLKNLNLHIPSGQKVGIVGESGAGKTTLAYLLLRLYDLQKGKILIDNQNIAQVKQESLRSNIAFVSQEPLLFHRTIKENIRYGKPNASQKEVEKVANLAHAHEFIKDCSEKYETYVGERGVKLSGGQKQRIAIARAMLKEAPILVLDEATSALDSKSESLVQEALKNLMKDKTVLAIAHRLSTLLIMDRIIVLDQGEIVEDGTHETLLKKKGIYAKLWNHQAGGFIN